MMKKTHLFLALLLVLPMGLQAVVATSEKALVGVNEEKKPYSVTFNSTINSTLTKPDSYHHNVYNSFALSGSYVFKNKLTLSIAGSLKKDLDGLLHETIGDTYFGVSRQIMKSEGIWSMTGKVGVLFPTNEDKRDFDTFRGALKAGTTLSYDFKKAGIDGLKASWALGVNRNFYEYTHGRYGINSQFGFNNSARLSYRLGQFSVSTSFGYMQAWSYSNQRLPDSFSLGTSASYQPAGKMKWLNVTAGYANSGSAFNTNGTDANIELFDSLTSLVYLSLAATY